MRRFKKLMLVTAAVGGIGLTGAGTVQAADGGGDPHPAIDNTQLLQCDQEFNASLITINAPITVLGDSITNIGNFCSQVGPRQ
ncbi:hypothetical protein ABZ612_31570 [Streptomyces avermitilis]|uniref:hypothetical protein n=1 Tax=Streptomyces avermitilis TaxID=33903 RepID=UPI0033F87F4A